jgi:hypothetical protein
MHENPGQDWQALAENYRMMLDGELDELAASFGDLTETAQQVLRNELRNRGLAEPGAAKKGPLAKPQSFRDPPLRNSGNPDANAGETDEDGGDDGSPLEYTWKTPLCECDDEEHALAICEMLRRAGIERWYELPGRGWSIGGPRVVVAADQLEEARQVVAKPVPQDILDDLREKVPVYEPPKCPKCGAEDPVLESAEPSNSWLCEACGKQWTEPVADPVADRDGRPESSGR